MKNVSVKGAITRQARQFIVFGFGGVALAIFLFALSSILSTVRLAVPGTSDYNTIQFVANFMRLLMWIAGIAGIASIIRGLTFKRDNPHAETVRGVLGPALPDDYTFIPSINSLRLGYIDAVLVGPPGVLVFRIVQQGGTLLHEGSRWLKPGPDGKWLPAGFRATRECLVDMRAVKAYLARKQIVTDAIFGVVVLIGNANISEKDPRIPGVTLDGLLDRLRAGYMAKQRLEPALATTITDALTTL